MPNLFKFARFTNRLSNIQKFIFVSILFWIALLPLIFFVIYIYYGVSTLLDREIQGNNYQRHLRKLIEFIPRHQALIHQYLLGHPERKAEILNLETQIQDGFKQLKTIYQAHRKTIFKSEVPYLSLPYYTSPEDLEQSWQNLSKNTFNLSSEKSDQLHDQLTEDLMKFFNFIGDAYRLVTDSELNATYLINVILFDLPKAQSLLFQASYEAEKLLQDREINPSTRDHLGILLQLLEARLEEIREGMEKAAFYSKKEGVSNPYFTAYENNIRQVVRTMRRNILNVEKPLISYEELTSLTDQALLAGFRLWDFTQNTLDQLFIERKTLLRERFWLSFILSLALEVAAFLFGYTLTMQAAHRLRKLTEATESFTAGNLSVRVPITHHDEIGRLGVAFNRMAQRLKEMINQLHQLLEGNRALADGELSARIQTGGTQGEFSQVAQSFNTMAENIEDLARRLKKLGIALGTSAAEMSLSSKEQETILVEQEATTREIAISANQISSRAKEFANTLKDISTVADKTSYLAVEGKTSLSHMEAIMRQMVEASTNIASKLAILNEKAGNITSVITTITKVADQTNLLSLNASIEAEKAGEYGRSFAVIAREIRRLADQTAIATLDIKRIVDEIMTAVSSSVMGVDDFTQEIRTGVDQVKSVSNQLATIIEQVQDFTARFDLVNQGMQAQSTGAEQITESITQLSQTAQQTTQAIYQFHHIIEELNIAAIELNDLLPRFKISRNQKPAEIYDKNILLK